MLGSTGDKKYEKILGHNIYRDVCVYTYIFFGYYVVYLLLLFFLEYVVMYAFFFSFCEANILKIKG